jgi:hypothetical protein
MWLLSNPKIIYSVISVNLLSKVIRAGITGLEYIYDYMTLSNTNSSIKKYKYDFEVLDIELKLKLIESWLKHVDLDNIKENSEHEIIYNGIFESCHKLSDCIKIINEKINYHQTKWFQSWRSIYLDDEINFLEKNVKILDERLLLLNLIKK